MISNFYRVYSCHCLTDDYSPLLKTFSVRKNGGFLANYLWNETANNDGIKSLALMDEEYHNARTYIIIDNDTQELVCYFSLKAGFLTTKEHHRLLSHDFESVPGVEISNFAVNENYIKKHPDRKGIGSNIFKYFILPKARSAQSIIGIRFIYIFALPEKSLINRYKSYGFARLSKLQEANMHKRIRPKYDRGCIFMYQVL